MDNTKNIILETHDLTKTFLGFIALDSVNLRVQRGNIHAIIGPNGAGKTTCFNLLTQFISPTSGKIVFENKDITNKKPQEVSRLGMIRSFQISAVFPELTVLDNVRIALLRTTGQEFWFWRSDKLLNKHNKHAKELLDQVGLIDFADDLTANLPYGRKRALEIATTLAMDPKLMLLDEPTQGMGHEDVERITQLIKKVSEGRTVLMVEHNMGVVSSIADHITVFARGAILAEGSYSEVSKNRAVVEAYMGAPEEDQDKD